MLRVLIISLLFFGCSAYIKTFEYVVYDPGVMPSCAIKVTDEYWRWRDSQGRPEEIKSDLLNLYKLYIQSIKLTETNISLSNEKLMCNSLILMSPELARVMNYFGENASPMKFYYGLVLKISDSGLDDKTLTEHEMESLVVSVIQEVESKFLGDQAASEIK